MAKIKVLPEDVVTRIAAGEVIERPASVVKELVENALDAGATDIFVDVRNGGQTLIRVADNGEGMDKEDALLAFERHATSKLITEDDLRTIETLGFRGEALPSIASVSRIRMTTCPRTHGGTGVVVELEGGRVTGVKEEGCPQGTIVEVGELFYNTPARRAFLRSPQTELSHILQTLSLLALPHPPVHFCLTHNAKTLLDCPRVQTPHDRLRQIYGSEFLQDLLWIEDAERGNGITGWVSRPPSLRGSRDRQEIFLNRRSIRNSPLTHAAYSAYETLLMKGRHPVLILFLTVDPRLVDVNVHPTKREVRFRPPHAEHIHDQVRRVIRERLLSEGRLEGKKSVLPEERRPRQAETEGVIAEAPEPYGRFQPSPLPSPSLYETVEIRPLGQIHETFIVAQVEGDLLIVDQHAAHERILYEKFFEERRSGGCRTQPLLIPETVEVTPQEAALLRGSLDTLREMGMEIDEFGPTTFLLRSVPLLTAATAQRELLLQVVRDLAEEETPSSLHDKEQRIVASLACHSAVRARMPLGTPQMKALLQDLMKATVMQTCPHGRPTLVKMTREELERMFHRK